MGLTYKNNVEFALASKSQGRKVIPEPINFDEGNGNIYQRDSDSKGFLKSKSNTLEYTGVGYDFLVSQFTSKGIAEDVVLERISKDKTRLDERWRSFAPTYIDMGECSFENDRTAKAKATDGGMKKVIDSKMEDSFDITSTQAMEGTDIGELNTVTVTTTSRGIFLRSVLEVEEGAVVKAVVSGGDNWNARAIPFKAEINSDQDNIQSVFSPILNSVNGGYASVRAENQGNVFYYRSDRNRVIKLNGRVETRILAGHSNIGTFSLDLVWYNNGLELDFKERTVLDTCNPNTVGDTCIFEFNDYDVVLLEGESLAITTLSNTSDGVWYTVNATELEITEASSFQATSSKAITPYALGERLVSAITGQKDSFRSSLLEIGGRHEHKLLTQGFWVRQFPDIVKEGTEEERRIQFSTSFGDFIKHLNAIEPIAWWIEVEGDKEVLRVESIKETQQNFIGARYGKQGLVKFIYAQASKIKRKVLKKNFYSKIEIGSSKGGEGYDEVFGLQSFCGKAEYSTINPSVSVYSSLSPYRLGDIDVELPRRKPFENYPDTDTQYDSDIMALDCKKIGATYSLKSWQDDYESAPLNIYDPDSAFNLGFSPAQLLLNHGFEINVGLYHYPEESLYFSQSNCNSSLSTKKIDEDLLEEGKSIPHSRLEAPRISPKSVEFNLKVTQEIEDQITGSRSDGTPNWHGLIAVNTGTTIEFMRLVEVDTNKEGKHKLVEAFI